MKKIGIITIYGNNNYGNKLQNYAVQKSFEKLGNYKIETIKNLSTLNNRNRSFVDYLKTIKLLFNNFVVERFNGRYKYFNAFNKYINYSNSYFSFKDKTDKFKYDYLSIGSDQVWNPNYRFKEFDLGDFNNNDNIFAFSASLSAENLPKNFDYEKVKSKLLKFKGISVREERGKVLLDEFVDRNDIEVLIDPTMLLTANEWDEVSKKPKQLKSKKYILNYFLGDLSEERRKEIKRVADENNCDIVNLLDKNDPLYKTGPSEFLYLEKNAFLICTDSFHSSVFAILFNRPFIIFEREHKNVSNMNSRFDTLLNKFKIHNRKFEGKITSENLKHDYKEAYKILEKERKKTNAFLMKVLDISE